MERLNSKTFWARLASIEFCLVAMATASASLWTAVFTGNWVWLVALTGALVGALAALVGQLRRIPWWASAVGGLAVLAGLQILATGFDVGSLSGWIGGWKAAASTGLLMPVSAEVTAPVLLLGAASSWLGVVGVLRQWPPIAAIGPPLLAMAAATMYTSSQRTPGPVLVAVVAALGLAVVLLQRKRALPWSHALGLIGAAAFLAGLGMVVVGSSDAPFDLRARIIRPVEIGNRATPLASVRSGLLTEVEPQSAFTIEIAGASAETAVSYLPVVVLDQFDGRVWTSSARFEPAGQQLATPATSATMTEERLTQTIRRSGLYPFPYLPRVGNVTETDGGSYVWDPTRGDVAIGGSGDNSQSGSTMQEAVVFESLVFANQAEVVDIGVDEQTAALPDLTDAQRSSLTAYLTRVVTADDPLPDQLSSLQAELHSEAHAYNPDVPAGHSLPVLICYVQPDDCDSPATPAAPSVGYAEQSAASFALLARGLGVPSRVVVGYLLDEPLTAASPRRDVAVHQIHAWPEVLTLSNGWVRFEPTNPQNRSTGQPSRAPAVSEATSPDDVPAREEPLGDLLLPKAASGQRGLSPWWLLLLLPLVGCVVIVARRRRRRSRRRHASAEDARVAGAWHEARESVAALGIVPAGASTSVLDLRDELVAIELSEIAEPIEALAPLVDVALYAGHSVSSVDADEAWQLSDSAIDTARQTASPQARLRNWLR